MPDRELVPSQDLESGVGQDLEIGPALPRQVPARGNPALRAERRHPPVQEGGERLLPVFLTQEGLGRPAQRQVPAGLEPAEDQAGGQVTVEPVERVAGDGQLEVLRLGAEGLGARDDRPDLPRPLRGRLGPDQFHHVRFLVHGPHLGEPPAQREGELAGPAGQVEQAPVR